MATTNHHGMKNVHNDNQLCSMKSYDVESIGRFGRMFRSLPPLYSNPNSLSTIGNAGGGMDGGNNRRSTGTVPLGMIFLGQFIDHDITFDTTSNFSTINNPTRITNVRTPNLDLDCIFGGGPEDEPFLYTAAANNHFFLLTGETNDNIGQGVDIEKHDLARTGIGVAIIGDPRNDENRIISQLQLAFIRFYNSIYQEIITSQPSIPAKEAYEEARQITTWHYQWIVVNEFLPALCGKSIVSQVLGNGRKFYRPVNAPFIPVEFSIAAYRFGHSMIPQNIRLKTGGNEFNIFSNEFGFGFSKITNENQIIDWEEFFDINGSNFQKAEQLDTQLSSSLLNLPFIPSPNPADKSLATRNLRRGQSFLLPSGENVARHLGRDENEINSIKNRVSTNFPNADISAGTPLWLYLLAEAEVIGRVDQVNNNIQGEGLGPVGATIITEVILGLLELDDNSYLGANRDWLPSLSNNGTFTIANLIEHSLSILVV